MSNRKKDGVAREVNDADLIAASYHLATLPPNDPLNNADLRDVARILMLLDDDIDHIQIIDDPDPKKRHYKIVPKNPWRRGEFIEAGRLLGQLLTKPTSYMAPPEPGHTAAYTQRQARGSAPRVEYMRAGRHLTKKH